MSDAPKDGLTVIVGSHVYKDRPDRRALFKRAIGIDMVPGAGVDIEMNLEDGIPERLAGRADHIECKSVLEHSRRPWLLAANLERMMSPGGTIEIAAPFIWRVHAYPDDYFRFTIPGIKSLFAAISWARAEYRAKCGANRPTEAVRYGNGIYLPRTMVSLFGVRA